MAMVIGLTIPLAGTAAGATVAIGAPESIARVEAPSAVQAGDVLAAATTVAQARAALLAILTAGGIAVDDGTGAPSATADGVIPAWMVDSLAQAQIAGTAITVAQNAKIFDSLSRWAGGPAVGPAQFATFLKYWLAHPMNTAQDYVLDAIAELGRRTTPTVDLVKGAEPDAALPLLILVEEQLSLETILSDGGQGPGLRAEGSALTDPVHPTLCGLLNKVKDANDTRTKAESAYDKLIQWGENHGVSWSQVEDVADDLGEGASEAGEDAEEGVEGVEGAIAGILSGIVQDALAQGHLKVTFAQEPRPVTANEKSDPPNNTTVTLTFAADADMPQQEADCLKLLGEKFPNMDLPDPNEPLKNAAVEIDPGTNFMDLLYFDADDYISHDNGHYTTDDAGRIQVKLQTRPQKLPKGKGTPRTEDAMVDVTAHVSDLGKGVSAMSAAIFDHIVPWTNSYPVTVRRRETRAITITGSFNIDALIFGVKGTLNLHSCDGFDGFLNGTLHVSGGYENGADQVVTALTGLPSTGSGDVPVAVHVPEKTKATPDDPGSPVLGTTTTLVKKLGIMFVDDHTAELTADGQPLFDIQTGQVFQFPVTEGASQCPGQ